jgi:two-component system, chemotaxis family, protein-glutamate methylesterase/glutaminase
MGQHDIVVIGGSLGSTGVLKRVLSDLPADLPAAVFIVTHLPSDSAGFLPQVLAPASRLPVRRAVEGQPIQPGQVYCAVPGHHMLIVDGAITLGRGPRENMVRPAIDALFRSAALAFGPRVVGVVLSGLLDDGAAGLVAIKAQGGLAVVQHPLDAEAPDMPRAALEALDVDDVATAANLGRVIASLAASPAPQPAGPPPGELALEVEIAAGRRLGSNRLLEIAEPAPVSCPHCRGVLSEMKTKGPLRFRCQIGHAFTADALVEAQRDSVDEAMRIAMRIMEERVELVTRMARDARAQGRSAVAELYESRTREYQEYAATLRRAATLSLQMERGIAEPSS